MAIMAAVFDLNEDWDQNTETESMTMEPQNLITEAINVIEGTAVNQDVSEPRVGMVFQSGDDYSAFCYTYAVKSGFELFIRTSVLMDEYKAQGISRGCGGDKEPLFFMRSRIRLVCKKGGRVCSKNSNVTGCGAFIEASMKDGEMVIKTCNLTHNHDLDPDNIRLMVSFREIGAYFKKRMMLNDRAGIPISKNFNALVMEAGGHENLPFNRRDCRNAVNLERRLDRLGGDAAALEEYFVKMKMDNPDFFYAIKKDNEGRLLNVFWADARCRAQFKVFGDAVTYDTTFLSNR